MDIDGVRDVKQILPGCKTDFTHYQQLEFNMIPW